MKYTCPCCGYKILDNEHEYDICPICFWEDDWWQADNPYLSGGANHVSLYNAQRNYQLFGACEREVLKYVRKPSNNEAVGSDWREIHGLTVKEISEAYKLSLMIGLFSLEDVLKWVDLQIDSTDSPDLDLIEISYAGSKGVNGVIFKLDHVKGEQDIHKPAKIVLGLIYQDLISRKNELDNITYRLYSLSNILNEYSLNKELLTELRVMDDYHHIYSPETIKNKLIELLKHYDEIADQFKDQIGFGS